MPGLHSQEPRRPEEAELRRRLAAKYGGDDDLAWTAAVPDCPTFHPTPDEFADPLAYIASLRPLAAAAGICKIVPPVVAEQAAGVVLAREKNFRFTTRCQPLRFAVWDASDLMTFQMSGRTYTLPEYEKMANRFFARRFAVSCPVPPAMVERAFWREYRRPAATHVEYGSDLEGTAFSALAADPLGASDWNLNKLPKLDKSTLRLLDCNIPGVTDPMLYLGMLFSTFCWHVEDHYLYSINYHHIGAPKTWYGCSGAAAPAFEEVASRLVYERELLKERGAAEAYNLLFGKTTMFSPKLLVEAGVPVVRAVQQCGEFVVTFPRAYHAGFSHGFNCGEAVNFAMGDWFPFGAAACQRYQLLKRLPLFSYEDLLCKEAAAIAASKLDVSDAIPGSHLHALDMVPVPLAGSSIDNSAGQGGATELQLHVKAAFVKLLRFQHKARWGLIRRGASNWPTPSGLSGIVCSLCHAGASLGVIICDCREDPICLSHECLSCLWCLYTKPSQADGSPSYVYVYLLAVAENDRCGCGSGRCVMHRADIPALEALAREFESDASVAAAVLNAAIPQDGIAGQGMAFADSDLEGAEYDEYVRWDDAESSSVMDAAPVCGPRVCTPTAALRDDSVSEPPMLERENKGSWSPDSVLLWAEDASQADGSHDRGRLHSSGPLSSQLPNPTAAPNDDVGTGQGALAALSAIQVAQGPGCSIFPPVALVRKRRSLVRRRGRQIARTLLASGVSDARAVPRVDDHERTTGSKLPVVKKRRRLVRCSSKSEQPSHVVAVGSPSLGHQPAGEKEGRAPPALIHMGAQVTDAGAQGVQQHRSSFDVALPPPEDCHCHDQPGTCAQLGTVPKLSGAPPQEAGSTNPSARITQLPPSLCGGSKSMEYASSVGRLPSESRDTGEVLKWAGEECGGALPSLFSAAAAAAATSAAGMEPLGVRLQQLQPRSRASELKVHSGFATSSSATAAGRSMEKTLPLTLCLSSGAYNGCGDVGGSGAPVYPGFYPCPQHSPQASLDKLSTSKGPLPEGLLR
eukprot:SM000129S26170  [mRNA]  locus=s129:347986:353264:- [translate_table: standard]